MMKFIVEGFKKNSVVLDEEKSKLIERWESEYADWDKKQASVIEYLTSQGLLKLST